MQANADPNIKTRCQGNKKNCYNCGYRYKKSDTKWQEGGVCPQCGNERRCAKLAVKGYRVCTAHGGGAPHKGRPTGRKPISDIFSPKLPKRITPIYEAALTDERLTTLRSDIALLEARKHDLLTRVDTGESGQTWQALKKEWKAYKRALAKQDVDEMRETLNNVEHLINKGYQDFATWEETQKTIERKAKLLSSEFRHMEQTQRMISAERFMQLMEGVALIIKQNVSNPAEIKMITGQLFTLIDSTPVNMPLEGELVDTE